MDISFKQGTQADFNTSVFNEGDICFVNQSDSNDYIYRIGTSGAKIGIIGDGYLINDTEFKILKPIINSNNVKIGDMISATIGTSSYEVPSIIGYNATQDGLISNRYLMLDIGNNTSGAIIPNPNKDVDLGFIDARWNTIYTENILVNKYYYSKTNTARAISIDECAFNESLIYPMIQGFGGPEHKVLALDGGTSTMTDDIHIVPNPERTGIKHLGHEANTLRWKLFSNAINNSGKITTKILSVDSNYINNTTAANDVGVDSSFHPNKQNEYNLGWDLRRWRDLYLGRNSNGTGGLYSTGDIRAQNGAKIRLKRESGSISAGTDKITDFQCSLGSIEEVIGHSGLSLNIQWTKDSQTEVADGTKYNYSLFFSRWNATDAAIIATYEGFNENTSDSHVYLGCNKRYWKGVYSQVYNVPNGSFTGNYKFGNTNHTGIELKTSGSVICFNSGTYVCPSSDKVGEINLGGPSAQWKGIWATTLTIDTGKVNNVPITSDKRLKTIESSDILNLDLRIYDSLEPVCYKYKNVLPNDDFSRTHIGFLAQDVAKIIDDNGLTSEECALVCADPLEEDDAQELKNICTDGYKYYLNYNEFHGLHMLKNHQQDERLAELEAKNQELENTISELKTQIELFKLAIGG